MAVFAPLGFFAASGSTAPITCQNSTSGSAAGATVVTLTVPVAGIPAGSLLLVSSSSSTLSPTACVITDSKGNTWTSRIAYSALGRSVFLSSAHNSIALVSGDTITCTFNASANQSAFLDYATGINTSAPFDVQSALGSTTSVTAIDSGATGATAFANSLVYGFCRCNTLNVEASGFSNLGTTASHHTAYKIVAATGAQQYNPTQTSAGYGAGVAVFKGL